MPFSCSSVHWLCLQSSCNSSLQLGAVCNIFCWLGSRIWHQYSSPHPGPLGLVRALLISQCKHLDLQSKCCNDSRASAAIVVEPLQHELQHARMEECLQLEHVLVSTAHESRAIHSYQRLVVKFNVNSFARQFLQDLQECKCQSNYTSHPVSRVKAHEPSHIRYILVFPARHSGLEGVTGSSMREYLRTAPSNGPRTESSCSFSLVSLSWGRCVVSYLPLLRLATLDLQHQLLRRISERRLCM